MDFIRNLLNEGQMWGVGFFFIGIFLLNWCAKMERHDYQVMRDPKLKWEMIDKDAKRTKDLKKKSIRGTILTLTGLGCAIYGAVTFFMNVE